MSEGYAERTSASFFFYLYGSNEVSRYKRGWHVCYSSICKQTAMEYSSGRGVLSKMQQAVRDLCRSVGLVGIYHLLS